ncbi:hypothetical protein J2J97_32350 (plasmid) [Rhizobium bangladeshense]|uniref:hypothetical protein n=1 Tax=Rhizobium bangladeshense TaxID=1138189 RepID=UPI001A9820ED|nr:hypothetical protein [Rhizobium bangladeshense]QSY98597.1 hypothetical protein J2J97_32350 [Rhizobium bangladeshense]
MSIGNAPPPDWPDPEDTDRRRRMPGIGPDRLSIWRRLFYWLFGRSLHSGGTVRPNPPMRVVSQDLDRVTRFKGERPHRIQDSDLRAFGTPGYLDYDLAARQWVVFMRDGTTRRFEWDDAQTAWSCVQSERQAIERSPTPRPVPLPGEPGHIRQAVVASTGQETWLVRRRNGTEARFSDWHSAVEFSLEQRRLAEEDGRETGSTLASPIQVEVRADVVNNRTNELLAAEVRRYMAGRKQEPTPAEPNILTERKRKIDLGE